MVEERFEYAPDYVSPPGETLRDLLEEREMSQAELAERMGRTPKFLTSLIKGEATLSQETALQLERVLSVSARFWNTREQHYREALARAMERERLAEYVEWLNHIPVTAMTKLGLVEKASDRTEQVGAVLAYFGVTSPKQWERVWLNPETKAAFRKSLAFASDPRAVAAWLRYGELRAQERDCASYEDRLFRNVLWQIRTLTTEKPNVFGDRMQELCRAAGVALVFTPQVGKARISGATRWLSPDKALIQMSHRYRTDDHFWFTFFHEAGHVLLHGKRDVYLEDTEDETQKEKEAEADAFAANMLIPSHPYQEFACKKDFTLAAVRRFAQEQGIAPGILVGRLQHDEHIPWNSMLNSLKQNLRWSGNEGE